QLTTYTVTWTLTNTTNDLKNGVVSTTLPPSVTWRGEFSPTSEKISFNPDTKTVSWNVGNIGAGTGFTNSPRQVSFKVALTPSINQVSTVPPLTSDIRASAIDTYTESPLSVTVSGLTTQFADGNFVSGQETVVK